VVSGDKRKTGRLPPSHVRHTVLHGLRATVAQYPQGPLLAVLPSRAQRHRARPLVRGVQPRRPARSGAAPDARRGGRRARVADPLRELRRRRWKAPDDAHPARRRGSPYRRPATGWGTAPWRPAGRRGRPAHHRGAHGRWRPTHGRSTGDRRWSLTRLLTALREGLAVWAFQARLRDAGVVSRRGLPLAVSAVGVLVQRLARRAA
jgi:hypothetical protein